MARTHLTQTIGGNKTEIAVADVEIFQSSCKYTNARTQDAEFILDGLQENNVSHLMVEFAEDFIRVKRGCLVRRSSIECVKRILGGSYLLRLKSGVYMPAARREIQHLRKEKQIQWERANDRVSAMRDVSNQDVNNETQN